MMRIMLGSVAGNIIGSTYEFIDMKDDDFEDSPYHSGEMPTPLAQ